MTDRINAVLVVLEQDMRVDDAEALLAAMRQLKGVISVEGNVADFNSQIAEERARHDLGQRVLGVIYPQLAKKA